MADSEGRREGGPQACRNTKAVLSRPTAYYVDRHDQVAVQAQLGELVAGALTAA